MELLAGLGALFLGALGLALLSKPSRSYYRLIARNAWTASWNATKPEIGGCVVSAFALLAGWLFAGGEQAPVRNPLVFIGSGLAVFAVVLFIFNLVMAPVRLDATKQKRIDELGTRIGEKDDTETKITELTRLFERGEVVQRSIWMYATTERIEREEAQNAPFTSSQELDVVWGGLFQKWDQRYAKVREDVYRWGEVCEHVLEEHLGHAKRVLFRSGHYPVSIPPIDGSDEGVSPRYDNAHKNVYQKMARLQEFIEELQDELL